MKMTSAFAVLLLAALAVQQQLAVAAGADITCTSVLHDISPCMSFLQGKDKSPSGACCDGVRAIYAAADTKAKRQATCECLKTGYSQAQTQLSAAAAQALPGDCGLSLSTNITPDIDCKTIN